MIACNDHRIETGLINRIAVHMMKPVRIPGRLRVFALTVGMLLALSVATAVASDDSYLVYVGTYTGNGSEGIYDYRFSPATGESTPIALAVATPNPSFLAVDSKGRFLYAVNELGALTRSPAG